jgi:hypothetical protein
MLALSFPEALRERADDVGNSHNWSFRTFIQFVAGAVDFLATDAAGA